jgi:hypothetical protein
VPAPVRPALDGDENCLAALAADPACLLGVEAAAENHLNLLQKLVPLLQQQAARLGVVPVSLEAAEQLYFLLPSVAMPSFLAAAPSATSCSFAAAAAAAPAVHPAVTAAVVYLQQQLQRSQSARLGQAPVLLLLLQLRAADVEALLGDTFVALAMLEICPLNSATCLSTSINFCSFAKSERLKLSSTS